MNLGFPEMLFIMVVALLIFGPKKLPEIGRQVGKAMNEFKRASEDFKAQLDTEVRQLELNETRQRVAASSSEPEVSISPPEGTVAVHSYGEDGEAHEVLDAELTSASAEHNEPATAEGSDAIEKAHAASASQTQTPASLTAAPAEMAAAPAEHRNG
jgi:Tat protein translocase TatB subunit